MDILPTSNSANFSTVSTLGDQSNTTNKCPPAEFKDWHSSVVPACMLLTSVLGIVMNLFVLMVFCFHKKACTVAEIYLSNLAAADLFLMAAPQEESQGEGGPDIITGNYIRPDINTPH
ncbi:B2 bradykinin receptor isoform X3 [Etheostoma spectabile]|uniref:B2 bradykinin receptor isoform X3 n=1 Tax=Etheostoma spectabile TaxID=54343 RepID=UPI0013AF51B4|nr:B2 bradykinin receptor-like isoform X3 [Etheostoma spectabile]